VAFEVRGLVKTYGSQRVLDGVDLAFPDDSISVVLGPSGCGKTTLLNILAGLDPDYQGTVHGFDRGTSSYVFQEDRLLPWIGAADNIAFVLKPFLPAPEAIHRASEALAAVGLGDAVRTKPAELSGGMRRRVALARAFAFPSKTILLDEPFSSLDLKTRISVMDLFMDLRAKDGRTAIIVTHDVREALYLGDYIATLSEKPSRVRDAFWPGLDRVQRSYTSGAAAAVEARLYASILA
jgi:NitT/TauT family transport system ATP-binding protein